MTNNVRTVALENLVIKNLDGTSQKKYQCNIQLVNFPAVPVEVIGHKAKLTDLDVFALRYLWGKFVAQGCGDTFVEIDSRCYVCGDALVVENGYGFDIDQYNRITHLYMVEHCGEKRVCAMIETVDQFNDEYFTQEYLVY